MAPLALVVQNDSATRKLLDVLLTRHGCEVDAVANGSDALQLLQRIDYDLAVMDVVVPGASGIDLVDWLSVHRSEAIARTALLSSAPPTIAARIADKHPALRIIRKPFELVELLEFVETMSARSEHPPLGPGDQFSRRSIAAGAKAGVLVRSRGTHLELVHEFGYDRWIESWFPLPAGEPYPLCMSVRDGSPRWIASPAVAAAQYPAIAPVLEQNLSPAIASVPVIREGVVIGAAGWAFREPQPFDENEQRAFTAIADEAGAVLESAAAGPA